MMVSHFTIGVILIGRGMVGIGILTKRTHTLIDREDGVTEV